MKKFLLMCCFVIGIAAASHAQQGGGMRMSPADRAKAMQTQLKLTDAQTTQITSILTTAGAKRDSIRNAGGDREAMRPVMMDANQKIQAILTPDQQAAYKQMMADMRAKMQNGGGNGGGGGN